MKELRIKKGRPLLNHIILTADRYSAEELAEEHGGLIIASKIDQLKDYQTVISVSPRLASSGLEPGQLVLINIKRYGVSRQKKNSLIESTDEHYDAVVEYRVPIMELDGVECLKLGDNDIEFIADEYEYVEKEKEEKSSIIQPTKKDIIVPKSNIIL